MDQVGETDPTFLSEVWGLFGFGCTILFLRFAVRIRTVGIRGLQGDDFFAVLVLAFYTMDAATVTIIYHTKTNVESGQLQKIRPLTDDEIAQFEFGSKEELAAWYSYATLIWCLKGTMLFFFKRMTFGLWQNRLVKWLAVACAISYISVFLTISLSCRPIQKNWQVVPDPGVCTFKRQNFIVTTIMNVLTDAALFSVPLPLLWKLQIPVRQKLVIALFLSSGLFVITAAILRVTQTLGNHPSALNINRWGVRETIVGIFTVNVPILRPLFSRSFWKRHREDTTDSSRVQNVGTTSSRVARGPKDPDSGERRRGQRKRERGQRSSRCRDHGAHHIRDDRHRHAPGRHMARSCANQDDCV
ncbi:hypothetical protein GQ53DRAFT_793407 [Thozetella sp. PMI_491]|nr:hypothetical protein GQ53DRAFT_793407 [Thozetella sp. PMI_491]